MKNRIEQIHQAIGIEANYATARGIESFEEESNLIELQNDIDERKMYLEVETAKKWELMKAAALQDKIALLAYSGFRNYEYQVKLIQRRIEQGETLAEVLKYLAAPGYSEHHTGRAIDITTSDCRAGTEEFENTDAFRWLTKNAQDFSFVMSFPRDNPYGFIYEPWHWAYKP